MDFSILKNLIDDNKSFLITTHVNPDADAIGSEIALYRMLRKLGKEVHIINHSPTPYNLEFLDSEKVIQKYDEEKDKDIFASVNVLFALDFNKVDRTVSMESAFINSNKLKVCIDHHQDTIEFADHHFVDDKYSATGHILYDFVKKTSIVEMDYEIAYPIYAAIMTDTGSFRFNRTTAELHMIIADLLAKGVDPTEVYDQIYDRSNLSKTKLLGRALQSLKLVNDRFAYMYISRDDIKETGAVESDTENFVNYTLSIENIVIGILFLELKNGFKVSFRSKGYLPVNKLAMKFGGGGHINAAGARIFEKKLSNEYQNILTTTEEFYQKYTEGKDV